MQGNSIGAPNVILKIYKVYPYIYYRGRPCIFLELHGGAPMGNSSVHDKTWLIWVFEISSCNITFLTLNTAS